MDLACLITWGYSRRQLSIARVCTRVDRNLIGPRRMNTVPETRYVKSGDVHIAYQVIGSGPIDLVMVPGWVSNVECFWEEPSVARFFESLASFSRLIIFDKRGVGLSDPVQGTPTFEERMDDIRAVMDAVGSERAALLGFSEGAALTALYAASHPERTTALILYDGVVVGGLAEGAPTEELWGDQLERSRADLDRWGEGDTMDWIAPSLVERGLPKSAWGAFERASMSPGRTVA